VIFTQSEGPAARRRFPVYLVDATDGITPETGESGGQPQISKAGGAWGNTTATLSALGNGGYYVELTATELDTLGTIQVRYKSANTAEFNAPGVVVAYNQHDAVRLGITALPNAAANAAGGLPISAGGALALDTRLDANISSRMATYTQPTGFLAATFPLTVASTTNITGGTITTVTNLTNAPTSGDFTATMKTSIGTAVAASAVASVTGNVGGNVAGSVGSIATGGITSASFAAGAIDAAAIAPNAIGASELAADAVTEIGAGVLSALGTGSWASAIPWNIAWDAEVQSEATDALNAYDPPTRAEATSDANSILAAVDAVDNFVDTEVTAVKAVTDKLDTAMELDGAVYRFTTNALEQAPSGGASSDCGFEGFVTKSGSTYFVTVVARQSGAVVAGASLSSLVISFFDEDGTDLTFSGSGTAASSGIVYASGSLGTAVTDNRPVMVKVGATIGGTAYSSYLPGANLA
jgi:hypothetical protein